MGYNVDRNRKREQIAREVLVNFEQEIANLKTEKSKLEKYNQTLKVHLSTLETQVNDLSSPKETISNLRQEKTTLQAELSLSKQEIEKLKREANNFTEKIQKLQLTHKNQINATKNEQSGYETKLKTVEENNKELLTIIASMQEQISTKEEKKNNQMKQPAKPDFFTLLKRRRRNLKQYLSEKGVQTRSQLAWHVLELTKNHSISEAFMEQAMLFVEDDSPKEPKHESKPATNNSKPKLADEKKFSLSHQKGHKIQLENLHGRTPTFIHVPKTGGNSVKQLLKNMNCNNSYFGHFVINNKIEPKNMHKVKKLKWQENYKQNRFFFTIVRNPFDMLVSMFYHKSNVKNGWGNANSIMNVKTFEDFIKKYCDGQYPFPELKNNLFGQLFDENNKYIPDITIRFEHLEEEISEFCKTYFRHKKSFNIPHNNKSGKRLHKNWQKYYSDKTRKLVEKKCKFELDFFGYDYNGPTSNNYSRKIESKQNAH